MVRRSLPKPGSAPGVTAGITPGIRRRDSLLAAAAALLPALPGPAGAAAATPASPAHPARPPSPATARLAFSFAETGFDPPSVSDQVSVTVNSHLFEAPYTYAADWEPGQPTRVVPLTAAALPEISDEYQRFVITLKPGIHFSDDPAFGGRPRELVAADYAYTIRRYYDPAVRTEHLYQFENAGILGLSELRRQAIDRRAAFDYDAPVAGLRVLDRYRLEIRLARPDPRFVHLLARSDLTAAVAREVVQTYRDDLAAHPVGTGPFRLAQWRRASRIVLERRPDWHGQAALEAQAQAQLRGEAANSRPVQRMELSIVTESQPRWLAFLDGQLDALGLPAEFAGLALRDGGVAPHLARRGVRAHRQIGAVTAHTFFNLDDPVVGGLQPPAVALRRAVAMAWDSGLEISRLHHGQAIPAQSLIPPHTFGYDPALRSEAGAGDLPRARALLDTFGFIDRDGDGWREQPDGSPLVLRLASTEDQRARQGNELWRQRMGAIGLRMGFEPSPFGTLIRRALAGELMMWGFSWAAGTPDGDFFLGLGYGPNAEQSNDARFRLPAYDRVYERQRSLPDGPERLAAMREAERLLLAYMPYLPHLHPIATELVQARLITGPPHPFRRERWSAWRVRD